jgi:GNAT superfamily N-acetyltransferase
MSGTLYIKTVALRDLFGFAKEMNQSRNRHPTLPITLRRAQAQQKNPCARPDDTALIVAFQGSACVGYHGQVPGILNLNGNRHRMLWACTFFVAPEARGKKVAARLLDAVKHLKQDFATTQITQPAQAVYLKSGINELGNLSYWQLRLDRTYPRQLPEDIAKKQYPSLKKAALKKMEQSLCSANQSIFWKPVAQIRTIPGNSVNNPSPYFQRGNRVINWMIQNPWIESQKTSTSSDVLKKDPDYYFSSVKPLFDYIPLQFYDEFGTLCGFLVLSVSEFRNKVKLKTLDFLLPANDLMHAACCAIIDVTLKYGADRVDMHWFLGDYLSTIDTYRTVFKPFLKHQKRRYMYWPKHSSSPLQRAKEKIVLNFSDGDTAFS